MVVRHLLFHLFGVKVYHFGELENVLHYVSVGKLIRLSKSVILLLLVLLKQVHAELLEVGVGVSPINFRSQFVDQYLDFFESLLLSGAAEAEAAGRDLLLLWSQDCQRSLLPVVRVDAGRDTGGDAGGLLGGLDGLLLKLPLLFLLLPPLVFLKTTAFYFIAIHNCNCAYTKLKI